MYLQVQDPSISIVTIMYTHDVISKYSIHCNLVCSNMWVGFYPTLQVEQLAGDKHHVGEIACTGVFLSIADLIVVTPKK